VSRILKCVCEMSDSGSDVLTPCCAHAMWRDQAVWAERHACADLIERKWRNSKSSGSLAMLSEDAAKLIRGREA
jgi:hypothetical protein